MKTRVQVLNQEIQRSGKGGTVNSTHCVRSGFQEMDAEMGILLLITSWESALRGTSKG